MLEPYQARYAAPFAVLGVRAANGTLQGIDYLPRGAATLSPLNVTAEKVCRQIERYLDDPEYRFSVPFSFQGTPFQCQVWREICRIPSGKTVSYLGLARTLETAPRPIGGACGANRIPLVIPCHRVVASTGVGGFMNAKSGSPIAIKKWLLAHERAGFAPD
ncbi:MAG: methylated-DNA--[protein]-cysteine S-methyltransferase [Betaproteobacteria bacterium]